MEEGKFCSTNGVLKTDRILIQQTGVQLAMLMDLKLIPIAEIGKAFGTDMIEKTYRY